MVVANSREESNFRETITYESFCKRDEIIEIEGDETLTIINQFKWNTSNIESFAQYRCIEGKQNEIAKL